MYIYILSEHDSQHSLYTVGFYKPDNTFVAESDHGSREAAAERVHYLNGGSSKSLEIAIKALVEISKPMGPFSKDPLQFAQNTIKSMIEIAETALSKIK